MLEDKNKKGENAGQLHLNVTLINHSAEAQLRQSLPSDIRFFQQPPALNQIYMPASIPQTSKPHTPVNCGIPLREHPEFVGLSMFHSGSNYGMIMNAEIME